MGEKRLYRSKNSRMLCGVCGGIGEYLNIDPTLIRLLAVLLGCEGTGIIGYIMAAISIPGSTDYNESSTRRRDRQRGSPFLYVFCIPGQYF